MKTRIPKLHKHDSTPDLTMEERDIAVQLACKAAMRILKDRAAMADGDETLDAPVPLPESSRRLIRRLARQRRERLATEGNG